MTRRSDHVVRIERTFAASAEDVFDAWTSPEVMRRWLHCGPDWGTPVAEVDLRIGGKVRVVMRRPDGGEAHMEGEYTLIDRPHRLEMTWTFGDDPSNEQLIELSFSESEGSTTVLPGQQRDLDRRAPRVPGVGMERVSRPAGDDPVTAFGDRVRRLTPGVLLIAVAGACWAITAERMQGMDMGPTRRRRSCSRSGTCSPGRPPACWLTA